VRLTGLTSPTATLLFSPLACSCVKGVNSMYGLFIPIYLAIYFFLQVKKKSANHFHGVENCAAYKTLLQIYLIVLASYNVIFFYKKIC
jgi:hypothetical protein